MSRKIKNTLKSIRVRLFLTISLVILAIISFLILVNNFIFGQFYLYSKTKSLKLVYTMVNDYYNGTQENNIETELEQIAIKNNFDIIIKNNENVNIYTSNKDFLYTLGQMQEMMSAYNNDKRRSD